MTKVKVIDEACIGCGACVSLVSDVFKFNDEGIAETIVSDIPDELLEEVLDAAEGCPTSAIETSKEEDKGTA